MTGFATYPSLRDKVVFVTGGASGIGASEVSHLAEQGARIAFVDINDDAAAELNASLRNARYPEQFYQHCDVKDIAALQQAIRTAGECDTGLGLERPAR